MKGGYQFKKGNIVRYKLNYMLRCGLTEKDYENQNLSIVMNLSKDKNNNIRGIEIIEQNTMKHQISDPIYFELVPEQQKTI